MGYKLHNFLGFRNMSQRLTNIKLSEVSLVDKGANPGAHVVLMKRGDDAVSFNEASVDRAINDRIWAMMDAFMTSVHSIQNDNSITNPAAAIRDSAAQFHAAVAELAKEHTLMSDKDDILKKQKELVDQVAKQADELVTKEQIITTLQEDLAKAQEDLKVAKDAQSAADESGDGFNKADLPEAVQKKLDEQEEINKANSARIAKMEDDNLKQTWIGKCKTPDSGELLFKVAKVDPELAEAVHALVSAAEAQAAEAGLFKAAGSDAGGEPNSALEKVNKLADEIVKAESCTHAVAVTKVLDTNPELYGEYRKEMN